MLPIKRIYIFSWAITFIVTAAGFCSSVSIAKERADPATEKPGSTLTESVLSGDIAEVRRLLEASADVNAASKNGMTPLHAASLKGHTEIVRLLLDADAKVNSKDESDTTALILALQHHHAEIVRMLIDAGANLNSKTKSGWTALHWALQIGNTEIVEMLLDAGAEANDYDQVNLGIRYLQGKGVPQNYGEAEKWFRKAAKSGVSTAQVNLGIMYLQGKGVPQDYNEADKWFRKAAKNGLPKAQYMLGAIYNEGLGVTKDYKEAEKWFRKAAKNGVSMAQANLGIMYLQGNGVSRNYKDAEKWFRKAAKKGTTAAQVNLGIMYLQGNGVTQDYKEAEKWFHKAAEHGDTAAQYNLGVIYAKGLGVTKDYTQAYVWLTFSIAGSTDKQNQYLQKATDLRDSLVKEMTPRQINEAEELAKEWKLTKFYILNHAVSSTEKDVSMPAMITCPLPRYTEQARNTRINGIVVTRCIIRKDGTVNNCRIIQELGYGLDESAIDTIENKWRLKPATYKGKPVDILTDIETTFEIY